jgi:hypothetical protein
VQGQEIVHALSQISVRIESGRGYIVYSLGLNKWS